MLRARYDDSAVSIDSRLPVSSRAKLHSSAPQLQQACACVDCGRALQVT